MKNINISLRTDECIIKVEENTEFDAVCTELNEKLKDLKKLYQEEKTPIRITGKELKNQEMDKIADIIKEYLDVKVSFDTPKTLGLSSIVKTFNKEINVSETKFYKGSLRSGQRVEAEGSIIILGDVNSGAEVMATENIAVLGCLRGLAHAGAKGNKQAIVAAGSLDAVQIRIANLVKEIEKDETSIKRQVYVYADDENNIIIE